VGSRLRAILPSVDGRYFGPLPAAALPRRHYFSAMHGEYLVFVRFFIGFCLKFSQYYFSYYLQFVACLCLMHSSEAACGSPPAGAD
jgi:hypothetical protein